MGRSRVLRRAVGIFSGQKTLGERTEAHVSQAAAPGGGEHFVLPVPIDHVVDGLIGDGPVPARLLADRDRLVDLGGIPFAHAPVERLALLHQIVHGAAGLFEGGFGIESMALVQIEVVGTKLLQAFLDLQKEMLAGKAAIIDSGKRPVLFVGPESLGGEDIGVSSERGERLTHHGFGGTKAVLVRGVEEVDAVFVRGPVQQGGVLGVTFVERQPGAQSDFAHLKAAASKSSIFHVHVFPGTECRLRRVDEARLKLRILREPRTRLRSPSSWMPISYSGSTPSERSPCGMRARTRSICSDPSLGRSSNSMVFTFPEAWNVRFVVGRFD